MDVAGLRNELLADAQRVLGLCKAVPNHLSTTAPAMLKMGQIVLTKRSEKVTGTLGSFSMG